MAIVGKGKGKVKGKVKVAPQAHITLKRRLVRAGIQYDAIASEAGVAWFTVWAVLNGRKTSKPVLDAARRLLAKVAA